MKSLLELMQPQVTKQVTGTRVKRERHQDYDHYLQRRYGITKRQALGKWQSQKERCATCGNFIPKPDGTAGRGVNIDYCRRTNKVRGLLCASCNVALGQVRDSVETLRRMIAYLERG